jgi:hypothetical protein
MLDCRARLLKVISGAFQAALRTCVRRCRSGARRVARTASRTPKSGRRTCTASRITTVSRKSVFTITIRIVLRGTVTIARVKPCFHDYYTVPVEEDRVPSVRTRRLPFICISGWDLQNMRFGRRQLTGTAVLLTRSALNSKTNFPIMPPEPDAAEKTGDEFVTIRKSDLERILALLRKLEGSPGSSLRAS